MRPLCFGRVSGGYKFVENGQTDRVPAANLRGARGRGGYNQLCLFVFVVVFLQLEMKNTEKTRKYLKISIRCDSDAIATLLLSLFNSISYDDVFLRFNKKIFL